LLLTQATIFYNTKDKFIFQLPLESSRHLIPLKNHRTTKYQSWIRFGLIRLINNTPFSYFNRFYKPCQNLIWQKHTFLKRTSKIQQSGIKYKSNWLHVLLNFHKPKENITKKPTPLRKRHYNYKWKHYWTQQFIMNKEFTFLWYIILGSSFMWLKDKFKTGIFEY
jgi:hypothetical protein